MSSLRSSEPAINKPRNLSGLVVSLYLLTLTLLPWTWFPPFPWLHEHVQWSDALFAATAVARAIERWQLGKRPRWRPTHAALALYFLCAALSLLFASPDPRAGAPKLLGIAELCTLAFITSDLASRPGVSRKIARVIAATSLVNAVTPRSRKLAAVASAVAITLNIAATLGIPALVVFSALVTLVWRRRQRPIDLSVWGGLAGLAVDALAQDIEDFRHLWVMIGLADESSRDADESDC